MGIRLLRQRLTQALHMLGELDTPEAAALGTAITHYLHPEETPMPEPEDTPIDETDPDFAEVPTRSPNGYVYVDNATGMMINTLHSLERGAMVNAIYLATMGKIMPRADWDDAQIAQVFEATVGQRGVIKPVFVQVL